MGKNRDDETFQAFGRIEFTAHDLMAAQDIALITAQKRVALMVKRGAAERVAEGRKGSPARYRMTEPTIGRVRTAGLNRINIIRAHFTDEPFTASDADRLCDANYGDLKNWLKRGLIVRFGKNENGENVYGVAKFY